MTEAQIRTLAARMWAAFMAASGAPTASYDICAFERQPERIINGWLAAARVAKGIK